MIRKFSKIKHPSLTYFYYGLVITLIILLAHQPFWNQYAPIQEGWCQQYSYLISQGKLPYRDFWLFTEPTFYYLTHLLIIFFGNKLIVLRIFGLIERSILAIIIFFFLAQMTSFNRAFLATMAGIFVYISPPPDVFYSYYQTCTLLVILSAFLLSFYICKRDKNEKAPTLAFFAGLPGGLAFTVKHSTGLIVPLALLCFIFIYEISKKDSQKKNCFLYLFGITIPIACSLLFLYLHKALPQYYQEAWLGGTAGKGGLKHILIGAFELQKNFLYAALPYALLLLAIIVFFGRYSFNKQKTYLVFPILLSISSIVIFHFWSPIWVTKFIYGNFIYAVFDLIPLLTLYFLFRFFYKRNDLSTAQWLLSFTLASSMVYAHGMSGVYEAPSLIFGLALIITLLLNATTALNTLKNAAIYFFIFILIGGVMNYRIHHPFTWWGWVSPPAIKENRSHHIELPAIFDGLHLSQQEASTYSQILIAINQNTKPNDYIYEFPHMPIFYLISNRQPPTFSPVDYFDVCSDVCAQQDANLLAQHKPKIIIIDNFSKEAWDIHETLFRNGRPSGQRKIIQELQEIITQNHYKKLLSLPTNYFLGTEFTIELWAAPQEKTSVK